MLDNVFLSSNIWLNVNVRQPHYLPQMTSENTPVLVITDKYGDHYIPQKNVLYIMANKNHCIVFYLSYNDLKQKPVTKNISLFVEESNCTLLRIGQDCFVNPIHVEHLYKDRTIQFYHPDAPKVCVSRGAYAAVRKYLATTTR